jgi:cytochrome c
MFGSGAFAQSAGGSAVGVAAPLTLEEGLALAKARACLGCHQVDNKRVGPSFNAIAQRHADKSDAVPYIVQVIQKGGRGQWGAVPMPGQSVNHQDAEKLAQWILSLRK